MRTFPLSLDAAIGQVASRQYGVFTMDQAEAIGASAESIRRRVRAGSLVRVAPRVFRVAGAPRSWQQRAMAMSLWVGPRGAVGISAAAALHRLDGCGPPMVIDVITTRPLRLPRRDVKVHTTPYWLEVDRTNAGQIAVTSPARTLIDLAGHLDEERLEIALEDALRRGLTSTEAIMRRLVDLPPNQRGRAALTGLLQARGATPPADSALEVKVIRLLRDHGYPPPVRQKVIDDAGWFVGRVDLVLPDRRLIIEVDSFRFHTGRRSWDHDRQRRNSLTALGWLVIHATSQMLEGERCSAFLRDVARAYNRPL